MKKLLTSLLLVLISVFIFNMSTKAAANPSKVSGLEQTKATSRSVTIKYNSVTGSNIYYDYQIAESANGPWTFVTNEHYVNTGTEYTINNLVQGRHYYVRVRAFTEEGGVYFDGEWSEPFDTVTGFSSYSTTIKQTAATANSATLVWDNDCADLYKVTCSELGITQNTELNSITLNSLVPGGRYRITVSPGMKSESGFVSVEPSVYRSASAETVTTKPSCTFREIIWLTNTAYLKVNNYLNTNSIGFEYQIQDENNKIVLKGRSEPTNSNEVRIKINKINSKSFYKVRVRNYIELSGGTRSYSDWSNWHYFGESPRVKKIKRSGTSIKLTWIKTKGATSYTIYMSNKDGIGFKKIITTKKTSCTVKRFKRKKLSKKTTYYFYVVANKKVGKRTYKTTTFRYYR